MKPGCGRRTAAVLDTVMEENRNLDETLAGILEKDKRYDINAYIFVRRALDYTVTSLEIKGHVTGQELVEGIRRYTLEKYGPMAKFLLNAWGVHSCEDFGNIVFNLVNAKLLGKTDEDSIADFRNGYDFEEAFEKPFL